MIFSQACVDLVKRFEGLRLDSYRCPAGVLTIGYGHTANVIPNEHIGEPEANDLLLGDLVYTNAALNSVLPPTVHLNQNQWDALCSLCFNLAGGARALPRIAPKMWGDLLNGNLQDADIQFLSIDHALISGSLIELPGLKLRRQAEAALFNS